MQSVQSAPEGIYSVERVKSISYTELLNGTLDNKYFADMDILAVVHTLVITTG